MSRAPTIARRELASYFHSPIAYVAMFLFLLATLTRSMLGTYVGLIAFFVLWQVALTPTPSTRSSSSRSE